MGIWTSTGTNESLFLSTEGYMHEAAIAHNILDIAINRCTQEGFSIVKAVRLKIGKARGVVPESLIFAFDAIKRDSIAGNAIMLIDSVCIQGICNACAGFFEVQTPYILFCPSCNSPFLDVSTGYEMEITELEVE